jgi:TrmH family RNA methyltransferase
MKLFNEKITSRNNPQVKWAASLSTKKGRSVARAFIAEGAKLTFDALDADAPVTHIFLSEDSAKKYIDELRIKGNKSIYDKTEVIILSASAFEKISTEKSPQGIISVIKYLDFFREIDIIYKEEFFLKENERAIILSSLRDPNNLGAVIRSATAFGVDNIILSADSADVYNPKTVRSAMGSLFRVKITVVSDMCSCVKAIAESGRRVFAAELREGAKSVRDINLTNRDIVIIGNEGHGISTEISSVASGSVYIPISKRTESLNASVAAAVFMWEQNR